VAKRSQWHQRLEGRYTKGSQIHWEGRKRRNLRFRNWYNVSSSLRSVLITDHYSRTPKVAATGVDVWSKTIKSSMWVSVSPWSVKEGLNPHVEEAFRWVQTTSCCWLTIWWKDLTCINTLGHRHRGMLSSKRESLWRAEIQLLVQATTERFTSSPSKPQNVLKVSTTALASLQFKSLMCVAHLPSFACKLCLMICSRLAQATIDIWLRVARTTASPVSISGKRMHVPTNPPQIISIWNNHLRPKATHRGQIEASANAMVWQLCCSWISSWWPQSLVCGLVERMLRIGWKWVYWISRTLEEKLTMPRKSLLQYCL